MRINKYIAQAGIVSRRKADELILNGNVKVNGAVMREPGYDVDNGDKVEVNGRIIDNNQEKVYLLVNKPLNMITAASDDKDRETVMEIIKDVDARLFPVGRLDYNTTGALIMTNDGDISYRITHPKHEMDKTYRALVKGVISPEKAARLRKGVDIGGFMTSRAKVKIIKGNSHSTLVEISIHEGKNRQVRKMFAAVGNPVQTLERIAIGEIRLGRLKQGHYRKLNREEIEYLKNC
ncbi:MAG: pseudouridine synthase [Clostridiales bacterium]|nr:rRNA pseudouridine synthase [Bacillota bacterium]MEE0516361.1 pseudouridine synthase [Anaerovoracaceae bacterium]PWL92905.1 MAG: pseudouridine synthase [Clostridiales bacterium]